MSSLREPETPPGADDLVERGQRVYDEALRDQLEPAHAGRFVAVEPDTARYFLGETGTAALLAARAAMPGSLFYLMRVGRRAAHTVGGHASRVG